VKNVKPLKEFKRQFQRGKQQKLQEELNNNSNPQDFWKSIGSLAIANERKQYIPYTVMDDNGHIQTDKAAVHAK